MNSKNKFAIFIFLYILGICFALYFLNAGRSSEYSYTADLGDYTVSRGELSESGEALFIDESFGYNGEFAFSPGMQFRTGEYDITVHYHSTGDNTLHLSANANYELYIPMPASQDSVTARAVIYPSADDFRIWLIYNGTGDRR